MRSDYSLYVVAIICFIIAGVFVANQVPNYTLMDQSGIAVTMIFLLIGIISAAVGYSVRPKAAMPTTQTTPTLATLPQETTTPPVQTPLEETMSPPMPPQETTPETQPTTPEPSTQVMAPTETEQPVTTAKEEKPKPARRRRKKASA